MKLLLAVCLIFSLVYAEDVIPSQEKMLEYRKECLKSENVPKNFEDKLYVGLYPDDPIVHCYVRCTMTKYGIWDDTTGYNTEKYLEYLKALGNTASKEDIEKCNSKNGEDWNACKWAYKGFNCLLDNNLIKPLKSS